MNTSTDWHVPDQVLDAYVLDPLTLSEAAATSAEAHLLSCARCRAHVATATPRLPLDATWHAVVDVIDRPRRSLVQRFLELLGLRPEVARLAAATPHLQVAWVVAVAAVTALAVLAADQADLRSVFLVLAPIVPLGSVAVSFLPGAEPGGEAGFAAPISGTSLVLRRSVAVVGSSVLVLLLGAAFLPGVGVAASGWVLPSLALALAALAAATRWAVEMAAAVLAAGWLVLVGLLHASSGAPLAGSVVFDPAGQVAALGCALAASAVLVARRDHLTLLGGS